MSILEKAPDFYQEPASQPAAQAGVFYGQYEVNQGNGIFEAQDAIQTLQRAGRLAGLIAMPGEVTIYYLPES